MNGNSTKTKRRWGRMLLIVVSTLGVIGFVALTVAQRTSDGPLSDIVAGGPLAHGELVTDAVADWSALVGGVCDSTGCPDMDPVEFELTHYGTSRWVGVMVKDGELFIPCDLGFMWNRFEGLQRVILGVIWVFKRWHLDAEREGASMLRIDNRRYPLMAERVTDPALITALKRQLETMARVWVAPDSLGERPQSGPRDIWFFRLRTRDAP